MSSDSQKVLFAIDGILFFGNMGNYYGVDVNDSIFDRYLNLRRSLRLLLGTWQITEKGKDRIPKITNSNCKIISAPNFKSISGFFRHRSIAKEIIKEEVKQRIDVIVVCLTSAIVLFKETILAGPAVVSSNISPIREVMPKSAHEFMFNPTDSGSFLEK